MIDNKAKTQFPVPAVIKIGMPYLECFSVSLMTDTMLSSESGELDTELSESRSSV